MSLRALARLSLPLYCKHWPALEQPFFMRRPDVGELAERQQCTNGKEAVSLKHDDREPLPFVEHLGRAWYLT